MREKKDGKLDRITKEAWEDNWDRVDMDGVMEIFEYPRVQKQLNIYRDYLPKDRKILEGGCGLGPYVIYLRNQGYDIIGLDYNEGPLAKIKSYDRKIPVLCGDVLRLPFCDNSFGAYLSLGVIEHFTEGPIAAIREANRVLAPGGYFIVQLPRFSIFNMVSYPFDMLKRSKWLRSVFKKESRKYYWQQYFGIGEISGALEKNGFKVLKVLPIDHEHALVAFSGIFRDKNTYDGANKMALSITKFLEKYMKWISAAEMMVICSKIET